MRLSLRCNPEAKPVGLPRSWPLVRGTSPRGNRRSALGRPGPHDLGSCHEGRARRHGRDSRRHLPRNGHGRKKRHNGEAHPLPGRAGRKRHHHRRGRDPRMEEGGRRRERLQHTLAAPVHRLEQDGHAPGRRLPHDDRPLRTGLHPRLPAPPGARARQAQPRDVLRRSGRQAALRLPARQRGPVEGAAAREASARQLLWHVKGDHVHLRGIRFRYAANMAQHGAARFEGDHGVVEDCVFE